MLTLNIQVATIAEAERIIDRLRDPSATQPDCSGVQFDMPEREPLPHEPLAAMQAVQEKYGVADMARPLAILAKFGAGNLRELSPADYRAFIAECEGA